MTAQRPPPVLTRLIAVGVVFLSGCASRTAQTPRPMPAEFAKPAAAAPPGPLTVNTSIEAICASPAGIAVLDRDLPGLTTRPEFPMFKAMTLKQIEPMSKGHITDAVLAKVAQDLAALNTQSAQK